jgi:RNA polymerase sigma-70 factor (ECF subfamily)
MAGAGTLQELRPLVFSIAYRMLGTVSDAEDVAQEAMLRIHRGAQEGVELTNPDAYATTVATRLALDAARTAHRRRETYVGTWLPEPILSDDSDPAHRLEVDEAVSLALLIVLQRLSPIERAVFLLRDTFGYAYSDIATILDRSEAACRQSLSRAQRHVAAGQVRFDPTPEERQALAAAFFSAIRAGDLARLEGLLAAEVRFEADGGGKAPAIKAPLIGSVAVARFLLGLQRQADRFGAGLEPVVANGQPAARLVGPDGGTLGVLCLDICDGVVVAAHNQINPDKLGHLAPLGDISALIARGGSPAPSPRSADRRKLSVDRPQRGNDARQPFVPQRISGAPGDADMELGVVAGEWDRHDGGRGPDHPGGVRGDQRNGATPT